MEYLWCDKKQLELMKRLPLMVLDFTFREDFPRIFLNILCGHHGQVQIRLIKQRNVIFRQIITKSSCVFFVKGKIHNTHPENNRLVIVGKPNEVLEDFLEQIDPMSCVGGWIVSFLRQLMR